MALCRFCVFLLVERLERSNATRTSVAADGLTEANLYLRLRRRCKRVSPLGPKVQNPLLRILDFSVCTERDSKDKMRLSGGQSLADGSTAATPLFSSLREENANESRHEGK